MTTLSIRVPDSLHRAIKELATKDGYSMNQFLITAAAEKLSALETVDYLRHRAFSPGYLIPTQIRVTNCLQNTEGESGRGDGTAPLPHHPACGCASL